MQSSPERPPESVASGNGQPSSSNAYLASVLATGLAAALVAVLTSFVGIQGTIVGAVVGAMVGSATSQLAITPLRAVERRLIRVGFSASRLRRLGLLRGVLVTPGAPLKLLRAVPRQALFGVLAIGLVGFIVGLTAISAAELVRGRPLSADAESRVSAPTTIGRLVQPAEPAPAPVTGPPVLNATVGPTTVSSPTVRSGAPSPTADSTSEGTLAVTSPTALNETAAGQFPPTPVASPPASQPQVPTPVPTILPMTPPATAPIAPLMTVAPAPLQVTMLPMATAIVAPTPPALLSTPAPLATVPPPLTLPSSQQSPVP